MNKPKILIFIDWYKPGYKAGGPIMSISNMVDAMKSDFDFFIVTSDCDHTEKTPYENITPATWTKVDGANVLYLPRKAYTNMEEYSELIMQHGSYKTMILNSLWSKHFTHTPLRLFKKYVDVAYVFPRGMLGKGAMNIKPIKKQIGLMMLKLAKRFDDVVWLGTSKEEIQEIKKYFNTDKVIEAPNFYNPVLDRFYNKDKPKYGLKIIFPARINRKKNLLFALKVLAKLDSVYDVQMDVYGECDDIVYYNDALNMIKKYKLKVDFKKPYKSAECDKVFANYHLMFLPTNHENYGHSIVEAMAARVPVVISDHTPWRRLNELSIGMDISLSDIHMFVAAIESFANMTQEKYDQYRNDSKFKDLINQGITKIQYQALLHNAFVFDGDKLDSIYE